MEFTLQQALGALPITYTVTSKKFMEKDDLKQLVADFNDFRFHNRLKTAATTGRDHQYVLTVKYASDGKTWGAITIRTVTTKTVTISGSDRFSAYMGIVLANALALTYSGNITIEHTKLVIPGKAGAYPDYYSYLTFLNMMAKVHTVALYDKTCPSELYEAH